MAKAQGILNLIKIALITEFASMNMNAKINNNKLIQAGLNINFFLGQVLTGSGITLFKSLGYLLRVKVVFFF